MQPFTAHETTIFFLMRYLGETNLEKIFKKTEYYIKKDIINFQYSHFNSYFSILKR